MNACVGHPHSVPQLPSASRPTATADMHLLRVIESTGTHLCIFILRNMSVPLAEGVSSVGQGRISPMRGKRTEIAERYPHILKSVALYRKSGFTPFHDDIVTRKQYYSASRTHLNPMYGDRWASGFRTETCTIDAGEAQDPPRWTEVPCPISNGASPPGYGP